MSSSSCAILPLLVMPLIFLWGPTACQRGSDKDLQIDGNLALARCSTRVQA